MKLDLDKEELRTLIRSEIQLLAKNVDYYYTLQYVDRVADVKKRLKRLVELVDELTEEMTGKFSVST